MDYEKSVGFVGAVLSIITSLVTIYAAFRKPSERSIANEEQNSFLSFNIGCG